MITDYNFKINTQLENKRYPKMKPLNEGLLKKIREIDLEEVLEIRLGEVEGKEADLERADLELTLIGLVREEREDLIDKFKISFTKEKELVEKYKRINFHGNCSLRNLRAYYALITSKELYGGANALSPFFSDYLFFIKNFASDYNNLCGYSYYSNIGPETRIRGSN